MTVLSHKSPIHVGAVSLTVRDLATMGEYYERVLGLHVLSAEPGSCALGADDTVLLRLREDKSAASPAPGEAGLFHTAFLLPARADLARWTAHAIENSLAVSGASDHLVSEAIYLNDPEGNGIEIYRDREPDEWPRNPDGSIRMATEALDFPGLLKEIEGTSDKWKAAPEGMRVGHIHLKVGSTEEAEAFYTRHLGLDLITRYPGASFLSSGGYHHHIGANIWQSRGAGPRKPTAGLASFELVADAAHYPKLKQALHEMPADAWGNRIELKEKPK